MMGPRPLSHSFALYYFPRRYSRTLRQTNGTATTKASIRIRLIRIRFADRRPTLPTSSPKGFGLVRCLESAPLNQKRPGPMIAPARWIKRANFLLGSPPAER
jgi:hypothetical protein